MKGQWMDEQDWTSVTERLPNDNQVVLCRVYEKKGTGTEPKYAVFTFSNNRFTLVEWLGVNDNKELYASGRIPLKEEWAPVSVWVNAITDWKIFRAL